MSAQFQFVCKSAKKMTGVVRCCVLLMAIFGHSSRASFETVTVLNGNYGKNINIPCATDNHQDGVYMMKKKLNESTQEEIFYIYKDGTFTLKKQNLRVSTSGEFPRLTATFYNLTFADIGLYWCKFNMEEKVSYTETTLLWVTEILRSDSRENCQLGTFLYVMIALIVIICLYLLGFICVKVRRSCESDAPIKHSTDPSIYEEMNRNRLDTGSTLLNPAQQSTKEFL